MPIMNGMKAATKLRKLSNLKIIDLSGTLIYMHSAIEETMES